MICGLEITDEAWLSLAPEASDHLDLVDQQLFGVALPERDLAKKIPRT